MPFVTLGVIQSDYLGINVAASGTPIERTFDTEQLDLSQLKAKTVAGFATSSELKWKPIDAFPQPITVVETVANIRTGVGASAIG